jgi:type I restriction enzyme, S subunit
MFEVAFRNIDDILWIIDRLDAVQTGTLNVVALYRRKLAALDALKQSLLHEAFAGEL